MLQPIFRLVAPVLCALALTGAAHAANPQPLAQATASKPGGLVWTDTDKGTGLDAKAIEPIAAQFDGSQWTVLDNGILTITKGGKTLLSTAWVANKEGTYAPLHARIGSMTVDGTIYRDAKNMSQGFGELFINQVAQDGKSARSIRLAVDLAFAGGGNQPAPDDGGFGGF